MSFIEKITKKAKLNKKTIVLPETSDLRTLRATSEILKRGIANIILIGNKDEILEKDESLNLSSATIINPEESEYFSSFTKSFCEIRKNKGISLSDAERVLKDPLYFGVMLVKEGIAHGMVAGAINSTANTLRPALQILKTAPNSKIVSSFFVIEVPNKQFGHEGTFVFGDCGLIENPNEEELSEIAIASANSFNNLFNTTPKVGMLSYSTYASANSPMTKKVSDATILAQKKAPELLIDGELQVDAAIVPSVSAQKAPNSKLQGEANVLIFPNLESGNIGYKLVQRLAGAEAFGPVTQGLAKPVNDLSRGCSSEDIVGVVAITAMQAQEN